MQVDKRLLVKYSMHSWRVNFLHRLPASIWGMGGGQKNLEFKVMVSHVPDKLPKKICFRSVPF